MIYYPKGKLAPDDRWIDHFFSKTFLGHVQMGDGYQNINHSSNKMCCHDLKKYYTDKKIHIIMFHLLNTYHLVLFKPWLHLS